MTKELCTTVVTGGDRSYAWGVLLLVASMRRNGMRHPVVAGIVDWPEEMRQRVLALGGVTLWEMPPTRRCLACQKPLLMACDQVKTDWVCWADADAIFIGDCSEWLVGETPEEIVVRKYTPVPPDFTPENLAVWRNDVARFCDAALDASRYDTRVNTAFIVIHRKWMEFLKRWQRQIENVLPMDVGIIMKKGSAYFQTDESVLGSLLCFDPNAPKITDHYKANGSVDKSRYLRISPTIRSPGRCGMTFRCAIGTKWFPWRNGWFRRASWRPPTCRAPCAAAGCPSIGPLPLRHHGAGGR